MLIVLWCRYGSDFLIKRGYPRPLGLLMAQLLMSSCCLLLATGCELDSKTYFYCSKIENWVSSFYSYIWLLSFFEVFWMIHFNSCRYGSDYFWLFIGTYGLHKTKLLVTYISWRFNCTQIVNKKMQSTIHFFIVLKEELHVFLKVT